MHLLCRSVAQLHALELARCSSITPDAASSIQLHADTLEHLALVYCDIFSSARGIEALHMVTVSSKFYNLYYLCPCHRYKNFLKGLCKIISHDSRLNIESSCTVVVRSQFMMQDPLPSSWQANFWLVAASTCLVDLKFACGWRYS